jgi:hypothetical protein
MGILPRRGRTDQPRATPWDREVKPTSSPERAGHGPSDVSPFQGSGIDIRPDPRALPWADLLRLPQCGILPVDPRYCPPSDPSQRASNPSLTPTTCLHGGARPRDVPTRRADMTRRSALAIHSLQIRRGFAPSRTQLPALAFAFEQALPLIRKPLPRLTTEQTINRSNAKSTTRSSASGAHS